MVFQFLTFRIVLLLNFNSFLLLLFELLLFWFLLISLNLRLSFLLSLLSFLGCFLISIKSHFELTVQLIGIVTWIEFYQRTLNNMFIGAFFIDQFHHSTSLFTFLFQFDCSALNCIEICLLIFFDFFAKLFVYIIFIAKFFLLKW